MAISKYSYQEFSGGVQRATTSHIRKPNEVRNASNGDFSKLFGAIIRRPGTEKLQPKLPQNSNTLGAIVARFANGSKIFAAQKKAGNTESAISYWDGDSWEEVYAGLPANADIEFMDDLGELWVGSYDETTDTIGQPFTIDENMDVSTTRQLFAAPHARAYMEFNGAVYAANVDINGNRYPDRLYKSSGPMGAITFARSPQSNVLADYEVVSQVPVMTSATAPAGAVAHSSAQTGWDGWKIFKGATDRTGGSWFSNGGTDPGWVRYDFGASNLKVITHYVLRPLSTNPGSNDAGDAPKNWTFEGSNNGSSWTVLHTVTNEATWAPGEERTYPTTNTQAYRYYRINVSASQRGGGTVWVTLNGMRLLTTKGDVDLLQLEVDSARYLKPGMNIDVYKAGTDTYKFSLIVNTVDKVEDVITFMPEMQVFTPSAVNVSTDIITLDSTEDLPTGTTVQLRTSGTIPGGLASGTTYYVINRSATTISLASTELDASIGNAINITSQGTGNHRISLSYEFGNKDELWKHSRKGKLTRFWNTDYRNPERSDYIKLPAAIDSRNDITALGKISSRMFVFTETSMFRFDGTNQVLLRNDVGCVAQKSIAYYDSYMVWLDQIGRIWIRNEEEGVQDVISVAIQDIIDLVPQEQLKNASGVVYGTKYKLHLGTINGQELRVVYNFQTNTWAPEFFDVKMPVQFLYLHDGNVRPHFFDETGQLWLDESGDMDDDKIIPLEVELGDDTFGIDERKDYVGVAIYSKNSAATRIQVSIDGSEFTDVGQIAQQVERIRFAGLRSNTGTMINIKIVNSSSNDPVEIHKMVVYYNRAEDTFNATKR